MTEFIELSLNEQERKAYLLPASHQVYTLPERSLAPSLTRGSHGQRLSIINNSRQTGAVAGFHIK